MKRKTLAAGSALTLMAAGLATGVAGPAVAQSPGPSPTGPAEAMVQPATAPEADAAVPMYSHYFVPFLDPVWTRIHESVGVGREQSLFAVYDPLDGLTPRAKTSRVAVVGDRIIATMPVVTAVVGEEVRIPISIDTSRNITGMRVIVTYNPEVVLPIAGVGAGIPTEDVFFNPAPSSELVGDLQNSLVVFNAFSVPWSKGGTIMSLRFRTLAPGVSPLMGVLAEVASDVTYDMLPLVLRDGMILVLPGRR